METVSILTVSIIAACPTSSYLLFLKVLLLEKHCRRNSGTYLAILCIEGKITACMSDPRIGLLVC